jgi:hypothetical protein
MHLPPLAAQHRLTLRSSNPRRMLTGRYSSQSDALIFSTNQMKLISNFVEKVQTVQHEQLQITH